MYSRILHDESSGAVSYLLADLDSRECVLVDPRDDGLYVLRAMLDEYRLHLCWLLRTHQHDGRSASQARPLDWFGAPCIQYPLSPTSGASAQVIFGNELVQAIPTPGHTQRCLSFLWCGRLFCGDLLSVDTCPHQPRPALPDALWDSATRQVFALPGETLLFCGHTDRGRVASNVLEQRRWHPWLGGATRDKFLARVRG